jgi:hypothetical protein
VFRGLPVCFPRSSVGEVKAKGTSDSPELIRLRCVHVLPAKYCLNGKRQ